MSGYSEDLRRRVVSAVEGGMSKAQAARTFSVSLSSVKRYVGKAERGESLAPKKRPGSAPKLEIGGKEPPCRRSRGTPLPHPPGAPRLHRGYDGRGYGGTRCKSLHHVSRHSPHRLHEEKGSELLRNATSLRGQPGG